MTRAGPQLPRAGQAKPPVLQPGVQARNGANRLKQFQVVVITWATRLRDLETASLSRFDERERE